MPYTRKTKKYFNYITVYSDSTNAPLMLFGCINYNWAIGSYACDFDCDAFAQSEWTLRHKIVKHNCFNLYLIICQLNALTVNTEEKILLVSLSGYGFK